MITNKADRTVDLTGVLHAAHLVSIYDIAPGISAERGITRDLMRVYDVDHDAATALYRRGRAVEARTRPANCRGRVAQRHSEALLAARIISQGLTEKAAVRELASTLRRGTAAAREVLHQGRAVYAATAPFPPGALIMLVGPGASGKTSFARMLPATVICLDQLRALLTDNPGDQEATPKAVELHNAIINERMRLGRPTVVDSTNVEARVRRNLVQTAQRYHRPVVAVVFTTSLAVCAARNAKRPENTQVPADTLRWQHEQTALSLPRLRSEGISDVRVVGPLPVT